MSRKIEWNFVDCINHQTFTPNSATDDIVSTLLLPFKPSYILIVAAES